RRTSFLRPTGLPGKRAEGHFFVKWAKYRDNFTYIIYYSEGRSDRVTRRSPGPRPRAAPRTVLSHRPHRIRNRLFPPEPDRQTAPAFPPWRGPSPFRRRSRAPGTGGAGPWSTGSSAGIAGVVHRLGSPASHSPRASRSVETSTPPSPGGPPCRPPIPPARCSSPTTTP